MNKRKTTSSRINPASGKLSLHLNVVSNNPLTFSCDDMYLLKVEEVDRDFNLDVKKQLFIPSSISFIKHLHKTLEAF